MVDNTLITCLLDFRTDKFFYLPDFFHLRRLQTNYIPCLQTVIFPKMFFDHLISVSLLFFIQF